MSLGVPDQAWDHFRWFGLPGRLHVIHDGQTLVVADAEEGYASLPAAAAAAPATMPLKV